YNFHKRNRKYHRQNSITEEERDAEPREFYNENFLESSPQLINKISRKNSASRLKREKQLAMKSFKSNSSSCTNSENSSEDEFTSLFSPLSSPGNTQSYTNQSPLSENFSHFNLEEKSNVNLYSDQVFKLYCSKNDNTTYSSVFNKNLKLEMNSKFNIKFLLAPTKATGGALQRYTTY
ncbi:hypothetical protein HDU92_007073, partial [Lobulomyces angularis]